MEEYEKYQLSWMLEHGYSLEDLVDIIIESAREAQELEPNIEIGKAIKQGFNCLESVNGFYGELWASYSEWLSN